ncbi:MAG: acyl-CoA/acyl-ACP dehydrogenase [Burkholderiales bacterium]|nr:acyl-CoA/acyl-ACP dehydrogenase [Burkholderiales bacterium]
MNEPKHPRVTQAPTAVPLGEDYPEIRQAIRGICRNFPGEYWRAQEDKRSHAPEFVAELTRAGFLSALIPEAFGGSGLALRAGGVIFEEINASGCSAGDIRAQMYMMKMLVRHGSEEQKARYLPDIASGKLRFQSFGVTEPSTGSDTLKLKTRAVRDGRDYVVNGQKIWTSRALNSDLMTLLVRTTPLGEVRSRTEGLSVLLVDMRASVGKGMTIKPIETMVNHQTNEVFYDDLRVPVENLIGEEGKGFRIILDGMNSERILVSHESLGDCRYFIEKAANYARQRVVFERPIGQNQGVQFPIARAYAEYQAADLMVRSACALFADGRPCGEQANLARLLSSEAAWNAGEACMQTHGGFAVAREYDIERKWRNARLQRIAPISTNLILAYIGHNVLGMPKSY